MGESYLLYLVFNPLLSNEYRDGRQQGEEVKQKHPMQPVYLSESGVARFKANAIVRFMLDQGEIGGKFDLNTIARMDFSDEDHVQLAQLIGYSVSGFGDLSYVPKKVIREADAEVQKLVKKGKK